MKNPQAEAKDRLAAILQAISQACVRAGRVETPPRLVAVSKTFDVDAILPFLEAGQRVFGENRVQEAMQKWPQLRQSYDTIELHLIGPLQTNKVREAVALFDCIETLDRERLAVALRREMSRAEREIPVYVQVNIGQEPQKSGIAPQDAVAFVQHCRTVHALNVTGLMTIPPEGAPAEPYFTQMAQLAEAAQVEQLSMGMSGDFAVAIAHGSTQVRVGSALFGTRD